MGISQARAAVAAGVSRTSWVAWEKGIATPEVFSYVKIERALEWQPRSVEAILTGGEPSVIREEAPDIDQADRDALMVLHRMNSRLFGLTEADRRLEEHIRLINAVRSRTKGRASDRTDIS